MPDYKFGWVDQPKSVEKVMEDLPFPVFADVHSQIKDSGKGKTTLLYEIVRKVSGSFPIRNQTIGDCVSMGCAYAVDVIKAVDIYINKDFEEWIAETATEDIYSGSRVITGKGQIRGDGSVGAWAARYLNEYGALARQKYGSIDLSKYDGNRAKTWGAPGNGPPKELMSFIKQHQIETISQVKTYAEVRDLIANGYAVTIASSQGFTNKRDVDGFAKPSGKWQHQMSILACDDAFKRPAVLVQNSWGPNWITGPKRHNQPDGSFWVEADDIERYILRSGDCWAFSGYKGFKPQKLNARII